MADSNISIAESLSFIKQVGKGRWFSVFASFLIMIGCGSTYLFGTYSRVIKSRFNYNQTQINTLGFAKDLGTNLGVFAGLLAEISPPWLIILLGSSFNFLSFFTVWLSVSGYIRKPKFWVMFVCIFVSSNSQNFSHTAVMVSSVKNFPDRRGIILGLLKGFVGLGGAILTQFYLAIYGYQNSPDDVLLLLSWLPSIVSIIFLLTIRTKNSPRHPNELRIFYHLLFLSIILAVFIFFLTLTQKHTVLSHGEYTAGVVVIVALLCAPLVIAVKEELLIFKLNKQIKDPSVISVPIHEIEDAISSMPQRGEDFSISQALLSKDMALIMIATVLGCGSAVTAIDNLGQIVESLGYPVQSTNVFVSWISIFNFFGRVVSGFTSETFLTKYKLPRPLIFGITHLLTCIGLLSIAFPFTGSVYLASLVIGFGFGAQIPLLFTIISDLFGLKHYSTLLNCGQLGVPFGCYILNVIVVGKLYDEEARKDGHVKNGDGLICNGSHCYSSSFTILAVVTLIGGMASFVLAYRTREFYQGDIYKRYREEIWGTQDDVGVYDRKNNDQYQKMPSINGSTSK